MINKKTSAVISAVICCVCSVMLAVLIFTMPKFFPWFYTFYTGLRGSEPYVAHVVNTVVTAFYFCAPFAAAALFMMMKILVNILHEKIFVKVNTACFRYISWCCYAVAVITGVFAVKYFPLCTVTFAMLVVGTLLRVIKNLMQAACEIREENDLTI